MGYNLCGEYFVALKWWKLLCFLGRPHTFFFRKAYLQTAQDSENKKVNTEMLKEN